MSYDPYSTLVLYYILYSIIIAIQLHFETLNTILYYKFLKCIPTIGYFGSDNKLQKQ